MFYEELRNRELDEKRQRKALINYTHMVSRNTSQEEIACSSLKSSSSFQRVCLTMGAMGLEKKTSPPKINTGRGKLMLIYQCRRISDCDVEQA